MKTMFVVQVFLIISCLYSCLCSTSIPVLHTKGSYYEVGFDMGKTFKSRIQDFNAKDDDINNKLLPFITTQNGVSVLGGYLDVVRQNYPQYLEELKGIADGSQMPFIQLFTSSIRNELIAHIDGSWSSESCSDVHVNYPHQAAIGHNEDANPLVKDRAYIVYATILSDNGTVLEDFMAYTYPGYLPGNAFGFTMSGLVLTLNGLYPKAYGDNKLPRDYINRALFGQSSQSDIERVLLSNGIGSAYAFSLNLADNKKTPRETINYEVNSIDKSSMSFVSKQSVTVRNSQSLDSPYSTTGNYFHFNKFEHPDTMNITQFANSTVSSIHRKNRVSQLPVPTDISGILNILGDTADNLYPLYRTPRPTDKTSTTATAIFDLTKCVLNIYTDNPKTSLGPVLNISLPQCS